MTEPFFGEIQIFAFPYAPEYWAFCNGAALPIRQFSPLYALLGTRYGGDGQTTFKVPNLSARAACSAGTGEGLTPRAVGQAFGVPAVTLTTQQMPAHTHELTAFVQNDTGLRASIPVVGGGLSMPGSNANKPYGGAEPAVPNVPLPPQMVLPAGGGLPHTNQQPYLAVNFCIALQGVFPQFD